MKMLLLPVVLLGLGAALHAQDPLSFPSEEFNMRLGGAVDGHLLQVAFKARDLVHKAIVADNHPFELKRPRKVFPMKVTALEDGTLLAKTTLMVNGRCLEKNITLQKTEEPGKYSAFNRRNLVFIQVLPQMDHYIYYYEEQVHRKLFRMAKLMGKSPGENLEALKGFKKFIMCKGLLEENIFIPEQRGPGEICVPEHD